MRTVLVGLLAIIWAACGGMSTEPVAGTMGPLPARSDIIVIGDFGSGTEAEFQVAETIQTVTSDRPLDLLLTVGDNFYYDDVELIWDRPYGWLSEEGLEVAAAWGNHDIETDRRRNLVEAVLEPPGNYYSARLGKGKLIVLDSNNVSDTGQIEWLRRELETAGSPVIIAFHHPVYSCGLHGSDEQIDAHWLPIFEQHEVTLVLNGHDHHYERFLISGTTYVVTGGGGRSIRPRHECPDETPEPEASNYVDYHFVLLRVSGGAISAESIAADGSIIDSFEIGY
jgi:hypothetical protein